MAPSLDKLTHFLETQVSTLEKPMMINRRINKIIANKRKYVVDGRFRQFDDEQIHEVILLVNMQFKKQMDRFFNSQTIHEISLEVMKNESSSNLRKLEKLIRLNDILLCYPIPDLNGDISTEPIVLGSDDEEEDDMSSNARGEFDSKNYNLHGLVNIKREEIIDLIEELPSGENIAVDFYEEDEASEVVLSEESRLERESLISKYDFERQKLISNKDQLLRLEEKLKYYRDLKDQLGNQLTDKRGIDSLQGNFVSSSNQLLIDQLNKLKDNLSTLEGKLQDQGKLERLRRKIMINFEEYE